MPGGDTYGNITPQHQQAISLMAQAQNASDENTANALISQAMAAAQASGQNNAQVFAAVVAHAQTIQASNVAARPQPTSSPQSAGGGGGGGTATATSTTSSTPATWNRTVTYVAPVGIKEADPDIVIGRDEPIAPERIFELTYEDLSGIELINISRADMIDGQNVVYNPIKNLSRLRERFNPNNIIAIPTTYNTFFSEFAIDLILRASTVPYFDDQGNLIVEVDKVLKDEQLEVQVDNNGTINKVDFYDYR